MAKPTTPPTQEERVKAELMAQIRFYGRAFRGSGSPILEVRQERPDEILAAKILERAKQTVRYAWPALPDAICYTPPRVENEIFFERASAKGNWGLGRLVERELMPLLDSVLREERALKEATAPPVGSRSHETNTLKSVVAEVQHLVSGADLPHLELPKVETINELVVEDFASPTYVRAGFDQRPDFPKSDRRVYTIRHGDEGAALVVVSGKAASENPYAVAWAGFGRYDVDLRAITTTAYECDGAGMIREHINGQSPAVHTGEFGQLDQLMPHVYRSMGRPVGHDEYGPEAPTLRAERAPSGPSLPPFSMG